MTKNIVPRQNEEGNIGTALKNWLKGWFKDLFVSGEITDGNSGVGVTVADLDDAVADKHTHSNKAQLDLVTDGDHDIRTDNPHVTTLEQARTADNTFAGIVNMNNQGLTNIYQQTVTVAKSGGDYTSVQSAIDSITDASISKRYSILVHPGDYAENITMKSYVDLIGVSASTCRITPTTGTAINFGSTISNLVEIGIEQNLGSAIANTDMILVTGGSHILRGCFISQEKSGGDFTIRAIHITGGLTIITNSIIQYNITGGTGGALLQSAIRTAGSALFYLLHCNIDIDNSDTNDILVGFENGGETTATYQLHDNIVNVNNSGNGITAGLYLYDSSVGCSVKDCEWTISAVGNAYGGYVDSIGNNAITNTYHIL